MTKSTFILASLLATVLAVVGVRSTAAEMGGKIPGAGTGAAPAGESIIEGSLDKYDSTLNKLTIKLTLDGIEADKETLDAIPSLKAKDGTRRMPMALVKQGQKIRVFYVEKGKRKIAKDVEVVHDEGSTGDETKEPGKEKEEKDEAKIPGAP